MKSASFSLLLLRRRAEERRDCPSSELAGMEEGRRMSGLLEADAATSEKRERMEYFMVD